MGIDSPNAVVEISEYDINFNFIDVSLTEIEHLICEFLKTYSNDHWITKNGNTTLIDVNALWCVFAHATFVLDKNQNKLSLRIREPMPLHGIDLEDCIASRDAFGKVFRQYLDEKGILY